MAHSSGCHGQRGADVSHVPVADPDEDEATTCWELARGKTPPGAGTVSDDIGLGGFGAAKFDVTVRKDSVFLSCTRSSTSPSVRPLPDPTSAASMRTGGAGGRTGKDRFRDLQSSKVGMDDSEYQLSVL